MKDRWAQAFRIAQDGLWSIEDLKGISVLDEDTSEASQADDDMPLEQICLVEALQAALAVWT